MSGPSIVPTISVSSEEAFPILSPTTPPTQPQPQPSTLRPTLPRTTSSQSHASIASTATTTSLTFPFGRRRNKNRLYLALYPRPTTTFRNLSSCADSYHWCLLIAPKTTLSTSLTTSTPTTTPLSPSILLHHIVHDDPRTTTFYEETDLSSSTARKILLRVTLAKITDQERTRHILSTIPIPSRSSIPSTFTCLTWTRRALTALLDDGRCLKGYIGVDDWPDIESWTRKYAKRKRDEGRLLSAGDGGNVPTWNYWEKRQTTD